MAGSLRVIQTMHGLPAVALAEAGGESVSQSPLKNNAFSTFLDQNPPFELLPENGIFAFDKNLSRPMDHHRQQCPKGTPATPTQVLFQKYTYQLFQ
jgi:hypothetical protein